MWLSMWTGHKNDYRVAAINIKLSTTKKKEKGKKFVKKIIVNIWSSENIVSGPIS